MREADPHSGIAKGSISRATLHRHLRALGLTRRQPGPRRVEQKELIDQKLVLRVIQDLNGN